MPNDDSTNGQSNGGSDLRAQLVELLIANVERDRFPSVTTMDLVEELLTPEETEKYAGILMDRIREDVYPSISMLRRVRALVDRSSAV